MRLPAPPAAAAAAPATAAEDEVVKETGSRSWAEKDAELRSAAVVIEEAEGAVPPAKRAKMAAAASAKVQVKVEGDGVEKSKQHTTTIEDGGGDCQWAHGRGESLLFIAAAAPTEMTIEAIDEDTGSR